jgi:hypothetical protein
VTSPEELILGTWCVLNAPSGYDYVLAAAEPAPDNGGRAYSKDFFIGQIRKSIDAGRPVIGFGLVTDVYACLITGYYDGGEGLFISSYQKWQCYTTDWYDKCRGILVVGEKTGERLTGEAAYKCVTDWALWFRTARSRPVTANGITYPLNEAAYTEMCRWLTDDGQWKDLTSHEAFLKQSGLLLVGFYRNNLYSYLKRLDEQFPGVVNPPALAALERMSRQFPGSHASDLWLNECVDPAITDFAMLRDRAVREKVDRYVTDVSGTDNRIQWAMFMPEVVKKHGHKINRDSFEYIKIGQKRFIGKEFAKNPEIHLSRPAEALPELIAMLPDCGTEITALCHLEHHHGGEVNADQCNMMGYFCKADTPVPNGYDHYDVPTEHAAFATYYSPNFDGNYFDAAYEFTRDQILADDVNIPYPRAYWTAEVYTEGFFSGSGAHRFGYLFSAVL